MKKVIAITLACLMLSTTVACGARSTEGDLRMTEIIDSMAPGLNYMKDLEEGSTAAINDDIGAEEYPEDSRTIIYSPETQEIDGFNVGYEVILREAARLSGPMKNPFLPETIMRPLDGFEDRVQHVTPFLIRVINNTAGYGDVKASVGLVLHNSNAGMLAKIHVDASIWGVTEEDQKKKHEDHAGGEEDPFTVVRLNGGGEHGMSGLLLDEIVLEEGAEHLEISGYFLLIEPRLKPNREFDLNEKNFLFLTNITPSDSGAVVWTWEKVAKIEKNNEGIVYSQLFDDTR